MSAAMEAAGAKSRNARLPPEVNRILYVRNLPFNITADEMYDIFGKYGAIGGSARRPQGHRARRTWCTRHLRAKRGDHLSGFNVANRYLIVLYYNAARVRSARTRPRKPRK